MPSRDAFDDILVHVTNSRRQSMQVYLRKLLEEDAQRASNISLLNKLRSVGGGYVAEPGETAQEISAMREEREAAATFNGSFQSLL